MSPHRHHDRRADDGTPIDWDVLGPFLERGAEVHAPVFEQAASWLRGLLEATRTGAGGPGPRILDIGSGPGVISCLFARAFPAAEVVAVDGAEALLARARDRAARLSLADRVHTHLAELPEGLEEVGTADLIWSSKALHHIGDQCRAVRLLAGRLRPGGLLAVCEGGLPRRCLPRDIGLGRPGLQSRLDAATEDWFTDMRAGLPDARRVVEDWPRILAEAGLAPTGSRTFLLDVSAPVTDQVRRHLYAELEQVREMLGERIDATDRATLDRLLDPDDPEGLLRRPDVFLLSALTVHTARSRQPNAARL